MKDTLQEIIKLLVKDKRLVVDGKLAKNKVVELALSLDPELVKLLLSSKETTTIFFQKVGDVLVFDKVKFQSFISNKDFLPDSFTSYKNKIGLTSDKKYISDSKEVVLDFPYKDCILEGGQTKEEDKRSETFWNETLAPDEIDRLLEPKVLVGIKKYDSSGEHVTEKIEDKDNLIIKGNNLLVLHTLKSKFHNSIKLIYIDPPYNTGSDSFGYNDRFSRSTWLTFMKNRLEIAKSLLREDGVIFVQCDDNEQSYLKVLMDEVLSDLEFVSCISVKSSTPSGRKTTHKEKTIIKQKDYILVYKKPNCLFYPQYTKKLEWDTHYSSFFDKENKQVYSLKDILVKNHLLSPKETLEDFSTNKKQNIEFYLKHKDSIFRGQPELPKKIKQDSKKEPNKIFEYSNADGKIFYAKNGNRFHFLAESVKNLENGSYDIGNLLTDIWTDVDFQNTQNEGGISLPSGKKPEALIKRILALTTKEGDVVLDYHLGSGTTCAVAHKMNRRYIGIEQLDYGKNDSVIRLNNVIAGDDSGISNLVNWKGGGSFVYAELAKANQIYGEKIEKAKNTKALLDVWEDMKKKAFLSYKIKPEDIDNSKKDFESLSFEDQQRFLISILDKNLLYVPYCDIDDKTYGISKSDKELNRKFYGE